MNQKGITIIVFIILFVVLAGALGYVILVKKPAPAELSLDWKSKFGDIDWQKSVYAICNKDFVILRYGTSSDIVPCEGSFHGSTPIRHITGQEKELANFIMMVVEKAAPAGYVLGGVYGDSRDVWVEELNNDGQMDMAVFLTTKVERDARDSFTGEGFRRDTSHDILMILTPINFEGASKKVAEISGENLEKIAPPSYTTFQFEKTIDFDHDGKKEFLIPGYLNKPASSIFMVDYNEGTIKQLQFRTKDGETKPVYVGYAATASEFLGQSFLKDVDGDGVDEFVDVSFTSSNITSLAVYKWNGSFFDYSKSISDKLKSSFDPSKDIPHEE